MSHRYRNRAAQDRRFDVSGHVVRAFKGVLVIGRVFGDGVIEVALHIAAHVGIGVFIDSQRSRGVLNKEVKNAGFDLARFWQMFEYFARNQMKPARPGLERKFFLNPFGLHT